MAAQANSNPLMPLFVQANAEEDLKGLHIADRHIKVARENLSPEAFKEFERLFLDFSKFPFPEKDPFEFTVMQKGSPIKIAHYRYPCKEGLKRKGIVIYTHGYAEYSGKYGFLAKVFSDAGYDFFGMDQRGFGYSEGQRGFFESYDIHFLDIIEYVNKIDAIYGGPDVPKFGIGYSLGGNQTVKLAAKIPGFFKAIGLIAPSLGNKSRDMRPFYETVKAGLLEDPDKIYPIPPMAVLPADHALHFMLDPMTAGLQMRAENLLSLIPASWDLTPEFWTSFTTPVTILLGEKDTIVGNPTNIDHFNLIPGADKAIATVKNASHFPMHDKQHAEIVSQEILRFFNRL